ncbi:IclR family transcriptional regulator [Kribbella solani]|uniref:DNA-binding IclR family transcriptional regulator n=1 Tax=Kribbella solani TaxID=236067 RepID=A0A841DY88_9ACTN|nr:IclR family transcriptional regulator [Kribbella solani]MBB5982921.1 DNA-binding IclR family transcriptional regulator [Kribbella solani]MDX2971683.1 IclR family transcriptional regulator [Kribbella solani]MDX3000805.1 IclR family transcriptional regulator [Kribbella solani]
MSQSLARALQILTSLGEGDRTLDQLAGELNVHKTTVLRLLRTMEADRFVRRDDSHRYRLGSRLFALADVAREQYVVREVAAPHLRELNQKTGQTVHLAAWENGEVVYVDKLDSVRSVRMYSQVGVPAALHCTAVGKVLLAAQPRRLQEAMLASLDYHSYTPNTITDADRLRTELATTKERGWAQDKAEHEAFINCIGAPLKDRTGRVVGAVSLSVPDVLLNYDQVLELLPDLLATAAAITTDYN